MTKLLTIFIFLTCCLLTILSSNRPYHRSYCKSDDCVCVRNLDTIRYMKVCPNTAANRCFASGYCGQKKDKSCGWSLSQRIRNCLNIAKYCRTAGCSGQICELNIGEPSTTVTICNVEPWHQCLKLGVCGALNDASCGWSGNREFVACMRKNGYTGQL
jgi:eight-cysteine-cluster-containing protein